MTLYDYSMIQKVCVFTSGFSPNKKAMLDYFEEAFPEKTEIYLFTPKNYKNLYNFKKIKIVDTSCSKFNPFLELRRFCKKNNIQRLVNIGLLPYEAFVMAYASLLTKTDFLCFSLGNPIDFIQGNSIKSGLKRLIEEIISYFFSIFPKKIILISENQEKRIKRYLFFSGNKIFYLYPTIPTNLFKPKNKKLSRKKLNLPLKDKIIIFVGRLGYHKGSDILMHVIRKNLDKKFILIGQIIDHDFEKNIRKHNINNLKWIESVTHEELVDYYNASDLCFFPTRIEGTPLVPREAMSCGIPTIVSEIPGTESIKNAAIRIPLNADKMNLALINFFNLSKEEKKSLSKKSRGFIVEKFDDEIWKEKYKKVILD